MHRVGGTAKMCSCREGGKCKSPGKHPKHTEWQKTPPMSAADVHETWDVPRLVPNLGIATGDASGFWVLDIDPANGGMESAGQLAQQHGAMPETRVVETGSGGWHYHFAMPDFPVTNAKHGLKEYPGIDVRGTGGFVVAPPSVSAKGEYRLVHDVATIPQAPPWLLDLVRPRADAKDVVTAEDLVKVTEELEPEERARLERYTNTIVQREVARLQGMTAAATTDPSAYRGEPWNQTTFDVSCTLLQLSNAPWSPLQPQDAYRLVFEHAPRDPDFDDEVVNRTFSSAATKIGTKARPIPPRPEPSGPVFPGDPLSDPRSGSRAHAEPATPKVGEDDDTDEIPEGERDPSVRLFGWDDLGNAHRILHRFGSQIRWVEQAAKWAVYRDGRWVLDDSQYVGWLVQEMIYNLPRTEGMGYAKGGARSDFTKWAKSQRMSGKITAALREAQRRRELQTGLTAFDVDPHLFNVANGIIDLRTGKLHEHVPVVVDAVDTDGIPTADLLMQQSPVRYDPDAPAALWQAFLDRVMPDKEMQHYLQMIVGYSITGLTTEQALFIHHGSGANGKSVFLEVMSKVLGDYGQVVPRTTLLVSGTGDEHPTAIARQVGKRFLQASETAAGRRLDEEMVKGLTGGEVQTARFMNKDFFDFKPTGKIHLVTNHLPRLTDAESIWRRLHLIAWREKIAEHERDTQMAAKIIAQESEGVLAWAVQGAQRWFEQGRLIKPISSQMDLADYRTDQDEFGEFIRDRLEIVPPDPLVEVFTTTTALYDAYKGWAYQSGHAKLMRKQDFARAMKERAGTYRYEEWRTADQRGFRWVKIKMMVMDPLEAHR